MGPQNISFVKDLFIIYRCTPDNEYSGPAGECKGCKFRGELKDYDRWADIFKYFKEAQPTLQHLEIYFKPCAGFFDDGGDELGLTWEEERQMMRWRSKMAKCGLHRRCRVYRDMNIQKHLLFFSNARAIRLGGQFNPLMSLLLRREHGFIIKRWQDRKDKKDSYGLEILNPEYQIDLQGFTESVKMKGVYYENVEEGRQEEEKSLELEEQDSDSELEWGEDERPEVPEMEESEGEGARLGIHHFLDKEDDEFDRWDFPDVRFMREDAPRTTQDSPETINA
ncbi:hypothetical protein F5Y00DRAFT_256581 [Daldinia vernicosa]|uniref:uncharacterized protein n=1 Tax=Daldinia vernicosa TaxID=114800 RepID=UPI00200765A7|nr:uncharacterized protein F5Y00DRAFT_256581 [Daldinia vernicosa]KAI0854081.1 hypothetical protein F5Y00DRAFT_256581 [Daldinia vernicosa]